MAANFLLHRTSSLKCTGVNALSFPVHFNGSVLKLLNLGTTVKRKWIRCSDFQNMLLPGLSYTWHSKNIKIYKNMGVATKAPSCFNLTQNGHFLEHGWSDFYKTFESGFFDFKQILNSTKINKISCKIKYMAQFLIFRPPHRPPMPDLVFRAALSHFLADFNKKGVKMLSGSYCII